MFDSKFINAAYNVDLDKRAKHFQIFKNIIPACKVVHINNHGKLILLLNRWTVCVDEIGQNHLEVDTISEQFSGTYILQKNINFLTEASKQVKQHMGS